MVSKVPGGFGLPGRQVRAGMGKKKQVVAEIKVQITGGQATPAPPVGTALGPHGVNIGQFVQQFNEKTREMMGTTIPVVITVYNDRSFDFILKSPPAAVLLKQAAQVAKGAANPRTEKIGTVTIAQVKEIAQKKLSDLNTSNLDQAVRVIAGTARSMGITVVD
jgi:large subunit ribosomal protein L11